MPAVMWGERAEAIEQEACEMLGVGSLRDYFQKPALYFNEHLKRHSKNPQWPIVKSQIATPLAELRNRVAEDLARREKSDSLVPIDRDPVPTKYAERVRRYYEELGRSR